MCGRPIDQEIMQLLTGSKLSLQPSGLLTATRPSFRGVFRVLVFRQHWGVGAARTFLVLGRSGRPLNPAKPFFEFGFLRGHSAPKNSRDLIVKSPQLGCGHGRPVVVLHGSRPPMPPNRNRGGLSGPAGVRQARSTRARLCRFQLGRLELPAGPGPSNAQSPSKRPHLGSPPGREQPLLGHRHATT